MNQSVLFRVQALAFADAGPFDLELQPQECAGLTGQSGSGKTRLLRALADLDPHRGGMWLEGVSAAVIKPQDWRRQVALLPAESAWWHDDVRPHFTSPPDQSQLEQLGFDADVMGWHIDRLSSGEKQRLALLRMLVMQPRVLLLDEPTANLDSSNADRAEALITGYLQQSRAAAIWVGHDFAQLQRVSQCLYRLMQGRLVEEAEAA